MRSTQKATAALGGVALVVAVISPLVVTTGSAAPAEAAGDTFSGRSTTTERSPDGAEQVAPPRVEVPFSAPVNLVDAIDLAAPYAQAEMSYRFENPQIVGEYVEQEGQSVEDFLLTFEDEFGTAPQVVSILLPPVQNSNSMQAEPSSVLGGVVIETSRSPYLAPAIPAARAEELFSGAPVAAGGPESDSSESATPSEPEAVNGPTSAAAAADWRPNDVNVSVTRSGSSQYFKNTVTWSTTSPRAIPGSFGLEIQVDLYNNASATLTRPVLNQDAQCGVDFDDKFIAKNYSFFGWTLASAGTGLPDVNAYADYNDFGDACNRNSMSIGMQDPQLIPRSGPTAPYVLISSINARIGTTTSSRIGGQLDLVNSASCPEDGSIALTDCMGVPETTPTGVASSRATLGYSRGWFATPNRCWTSGNFGLPGTPPVTYAC